MSILVHNFYNLNWIFVALLMTEGRYCTAMPMQRKTCKSPGAPRQMSSGEGGPPMAGPSATLRKGSCGMCHMEFLS
jgi:hypothetical protein